MTMSYTGKVKASVDVSGSGSNELATINGNINVSNSQSFTAGTGSGNIDAVLTDGNTLASSGSETYDLDGSLTGALGESFAFSKVKSVFVRNTGATNALTLSGDFLGLTESITVPAGGCFLLDLGAAGISVTASTGDEIVIASASGTTYEIIIVGVAA